MDIVIATNNKNKLREYKEILSELDVNILSLEDLNINVEVNENGNTFAENSLIKALEIKKYTDKVIIADDSGLTLEDLPDLLGIHSKRFLGENTSYIEKNTRILEMLNGKNRNAYFTCVITVLNLSADILQFSGICPGKIANEIKGINGFGYDPIFIPDGYDKTISELSETIKNKISHRGKACLKLKEYLLKNGG